MNKILKLIVFVVLIQAFSLYASEDNLSWLVGKEIHLARKNQRIHLDVIENIGEKSGISSRINLGSYNAYVAIHTRTLTNSIRGTKTLYLVISYVQSNLFDKTNIQIYFPYDRHRKLVSEWGTLYADNVSFGDVRIDLK